MVQTKTTTFTVVATGIGRKDYSESIEQSVEPIVRSWQSSYNHYAEFLNLLAGTNVVQEISIDSGMVVMLYDFYFSSSIAILLDFRADAFIEDTWVPIVRKSNLQFIDYNIPKGFPFFSKWRVRVANLDALLAADCFLSAHGITTPESQYYGDINLMG